MRRVAVVIAVAGLATALYISTRTRAVRNQSIDLPAPAITLTDLNRETFDLASLRGEVVLVNFWAAWCTPCREEIPQFVALQQKYRARGFQAVGISMDDPEGTLRDFCRDYKVNYPIVMGNQRIAENFGGVLGLPTTFLIGRDGRIRSRLVGATDFPKLEKEINALLQGDR